ncbi:MAG: hypothetical protein V4717_02280 [Bacteroidota bacterium]
MKARLILGCLVTIAFLTSCQKELKEEDNPTFCNVSTITIKNGNSKITAKYSYEYDSVTRRATMLKFQNFESGAIKIIYPTYSGDTVFLSQKGYLVLDASKRLTALQDPNAPGGKNLSYFYSYNSQGSLEQRLMDDGVNDVLRTNFSYTNGNLTGYKQDYAGFPQSLAATIELNTTTNVTGFNQLALLDLFPELVFYLPTFQLGKISDFPLSKIQANIGVTNLPASSFVNTYNNYTLTPEGWLSSFQTDEVIVGVPESTTSYSFEYNCF